MIESCIGDNHNIHSLKMFSKYMTKGDVSRSILLESFFWYPSLASNLSEWMTVYLNLCQKVGITLTHDSISTALAKCHFHKKEKAKQNENTMKLNTQNVKTFWKNIQCQTILKLMARDFACHCLFVELLIVNILFVCFFFLFLATCDLKFVITLNSSRNDVVWFLVKAKWEASNL